MDIIGERLRALREREGATQETISKLLGTTQQLYSRYETNQIDLPLRHLLTLASHYHVSTDYLTGRVSYEATPPEFAEKLLKNVTVGELFCRITSFNGTSRKRLIEYVNYLSYLEANERKKKKSLRE